MKGVVCPTSEPSELRQHCGSRPKPHRLGLPGKGTWTQ